MIITFHPCSLNLCEIPCPLLVTQIILSVLKANGSVCVCVCVCVRKRERERENERGRDRERERELERERER